jgi:glycosyltransferase involved in cell wall biosynthesis
MKILLVLNKYLPDQVAGTELYVHALARYLKAAGNEVKVLIPKFGSTRNEQYEFEGVSVLQYGEPTSTSIDKRVVMGFDPPSGLPNFKEILSRELPDIVHFHEISGSNGITVFHVATAQLLGAKILVTFHLAGNTCKTGSLKYLETFDCDGFINISKCSRCTIHKYSGASAAFLVGASSAVLYRLGWNTGRFKNRLGTALSIPFQLKALQQRFELLVKSSDKLISITDWYSQVLVRNGVQTEKISIIPQALPMAIAYHSKKSKTSSTLRLVFAGRISVFKGIHLMLDAMERLVQQPVELDIYGQPDGSEYAVQQIDRMKRLQNVRYMGVVENEIMQEVLVDHDALLLASTFSEMSPLIIQQAFAAGIPVIASNVPGNKEQVIHEKNGLLFEFNNSTSLQLQLERCLSENELINTLKKGISRPLDFSSVGSAHVDLYQSLWIEHPV